MKYKVTGIDPGDTAFQLGNCLTMCRTRDAVNTPGMYSKVRGAAMGWMNTPGSIPNLALFEALFASDIVLDHVVPEPGQQGDAMESAVLVAALLIAFPDARFGIGLSGGEESLVPGHYHSLGNQSVTLRESSEARDFLVRLFEYLQNNSYWVDDDLVHMLALLSALCQDRDRTTPAQVLSLSTSGNHQVDVGLFHAYQLVEAFLEKGDGEPWDEAMTRWNDTYPLQLNPEEIHFIRNLRDISLHFKAGRAEKRLKKSQIALRFDQDHALQHQFRAHGIPKLLRELAQAYFMERLRSGVCL